MKLAVSAIIFSVLVMSGSVYSQEMKTYQGYIADNACYSKKGSISADGANLSVNPEKHTIHCLKMPSCKKSGFGLLIKGPDGIYAFTKLDIKGNKQVKELLKTTKRKNGFFVELTGMEKDGMLMVKTIKESEPI